MTAARTKRYSYKFTGMADEEFSSLSAELSQRDLGEGVTASAVLTPGEEITVSQLVDHARLLPNDDATRKAHAALEDDADQAADDELPAVIEAGDDKTGDAAAAPTV